MTRIRICKDNSRYTLRADEHCARTEVCNAVSTLCGQFAQIGAYLFDNADIHFGDGECEISFPVSEKADSMILATVLGFKQLESMYPEILKVETNGLTW